MFCYILRFFPPEKYEISCFIVGRDMILAPDHIISSRWQTDMIRWGWNGSLMLISMINPPHFTILLIMHKAAKGKLVSYAVNIAMNRSLGVQLQKKTLN